jgi:16S rRNA (uracil1498-N3)-methyltransferase
VIPRLFVSDNLAAGASVDAPDVHYLRTVLRLHEGAEVELFNGRDGGWRGRIAAIGKRAATIAVETRVAEQPARRPLLLAFAPIKKARLDFLVEKATELGVSDLWPVFTERAVVGRVNVGRLAEIAREAAEQCRRLDVPAVHEPVQLPDCLARLQQAWRTLFVADETGAGRPAAEAFRQAEATEPALLVGPEGGFAASELDLMRRSHIVTAIDLGPRILRAETAAVAALACWQAVRGDWNPAGR